MRRFISFISIFLLALGGSGTLRAQGMTDPTHWTYEATKLDAGQYQLNFTLQLDEGWHIWAIDVGGDGLQVVPTFTFTKNKAVHPDGGITEQGDKITAEMEGVDGAVNYYSHKVVYTQKVKAAAGTTVKGSHQYQVCNDNMCLAPKQVPFSFQLP
ncbi:MAG: hypothetical protein JNL13_06465 [Chitinophagaceae bacterium]|nr:hypothetical protein [Chitinophagaceae bacterium]